MTCSRSQSKPRPPNPVPPPPSADPSLFLIFRLAFYAYKGCGGAYIFLPQVAFPGTAGGLGGHFVCSCGTPHFPLIELISRIYWMTVVLNTLQIP